eukprot:TRINITY_DN9283_c0_g3_i2.p1 TRINITY_DN9283_c0_g3~~TRINITY_DN9283_c0_g3_i2.p1  ORF type:complete len:108 (+),score=2.50 TRINITY_DN9283_c0_g3_i2:172-495(+)
MLIQHSTIFLRLSGDKDVLTPITSWRISVIGTVCVERGVLVDDRLRDILEGRLVGVSFSGDHGRLSLSVYVLCTVKVVSTGVEPEADGQRLSSSDRTTSSVQLRAGS